MGSLQLASLLVENPHTIKGTTSELLATGPRSVQSTKML